MNKGRICCALLLAFGIVANTPLHSQSAWGLGRQNSQDAQTAAPPPEAVMHDGNPAVECKGGSFSWTIERVDLNGKTAFRFPVGNPLGTLLISADRIVFDEDKMKNSFDENRTAVTWEIVGLNSKWRIAVLEVRAAGRKYSFIANTALGERAFISLGDVPACLSFLETALTDFPAAERQFDELTKHLPPALAAAFLEFQPRAAAWRALTAKPPLSAEADRHWILAENAVKKQNIGSAVEHYEAALEIQPAWPTGWFDLAMIYGEQNKPADAAWCMKHYLELVPDAPNARSAREQMIIWEDEAKH